MSDIKPTEHEHHEPQTALETALRNGLAWLSANVTTVIYAVAAILAIAAVVVFLRRAPAGNTEASKLLLVASTPEQYQDIADSTPTSSLGMWSRLRQGDRHLSNAVSNLFTDRAKGVEDLKAAKKAYQNLGGQSGLPNDLRERVLIGLARVAECECDGSDATVEAAKSAWQELLGAYADSIVKDHAEERIARLEKSETADFYKWFAALDPKPVVPGTGSSVPEIPDGLLPNDLPGAAPAEKTSGEETSTKEDSDAKSSADDAAATEKPADDAAEMKQKADEKAAADKAAADKAAADKAAADKAAADKAAAEKAAADKAAADKAAADKAAADKAAAADAAKEKAAEAKTDGDN